MILNLRIEVDMENSGLNEDEVLDDLVNFSRDLLICGAAEQDIECTLLEVGYEI